MPSYTGIHRSAVARLRPVGDSSSEGLCLQSLGGGGVAEVVGAPRVVPLRLGLDLHDAARAAGRGVHVCEFDSDGCVWIRPPGRGLCFSRGRAALRCAHGQAAAAGAGNASCFTETDVAIDSRRAVQDSLSDHLDTLDLGQGNCVDEQLVSRPRKCKEIFGPDNTTVLPGSAQCETTHPRSESDEGNSMQNLLKGW